MVFPLSTTIQLQGVRQLTIWTQNGSELEKYLSICPSSIYFDFSCDNDAIPSFVFTTRYFSSMIYIRLGRLEGFLFNNDQFDFLISLFSNLVQLHSTVDQCRQHNETIGFEKVANCLLHRRPRLKILDLRIYMTEHMR